MVAGKREREGTSVRAFDGFWMFSSHHRPVPPGACRRTPDARRETGQYAVQSTLTAGSPAWRNWIRP